MGSAEEEIYITLVVVKRPAQAHRSDDPSRWAQTVLDSLAVPMTADASPQPGAVARNPAVGTKQGRSGPPRRVRGRLGGSQLARADTRGSTWILLGLSLLCFIGSACSFYFLMK